MTRTAHRNESVHENLNARFGASGGRDGASVVVVMLKRFKHKAGAQEGAGFDNSFD
jgi:hypothetical protein